MASEEGHLHNQGTQNPFQRRPNIRRSPEKSSNSLVLEDINMTLSSPTTNVESEKTTFHNQLKSLEEVVSKLSNEITLLKRENEDLKRIIESDKEKKQVCNDEPQINNETTEFYTDEEELTKETEWIVKRKKRPSKKRKAEYSPEVANSSQAESTNRKEANLPPHEDQRDKSESKPPKEEKPPPINIIGITEYGAVQNILKSITDKEYRVISLNNNVWKIFTPDSDTYRALATKLNLEKIEWYTYENKSNRPIKVMARGLHPTCAIRDIMEDLQRQGLQIENAANIIKREKVKEGSEFKVTKRGLPLFMLTFNNKEKIEAIFNIRAILNMRVKIEALRKSTGLIVQCKKCQGFNHTQKYCNREPRCVKCLGRHPAQACPLNRNSPPTCVNCNEQHPANYRGCIVAKELQKIRDKSRQGPSYYKTPIANSVNTNLRNFTTSISSKVTDRKSFSQVVASGLQSTTPHKSVNFKDSNDPSMLEKIFKSIEALNTRLIRQERSIDALNRRLDSRETVDEITSILY